jgi:hypothetical protein
LRAGTELAVQQNGRTVSFTVPGLAEYEVAALET